jgi:hypothetical protein
MDEDDIFHQDLTLINSGIQPLLASILDRRGTNILDNPSLYELSIIRFDLCSNLIPIFTPIIPDPLQPLKTDMSITLRYGASNYQEFINVSTTEAKYGVYNYGLYLENVNRAVLAAFTACKAANPGATATIAPYFSLDTKTSLISMYCQSGYLESDPNPILIFVNQYLNNILNLPNSTYPGPGSPNGADAQIGVQDYSTLIPNSGNRQGYPFALATLAGTWVEVSQEFLSLSQWSTVKSIVFQSSQLPIPNSLIPVITSSSQNSNTTTGSMPILTDFNIIKDNNYFTRGDIQYLPTAEYRCLSLRGTTPLKQIDIRAYYQTYDGTLTPIYFPSGRGMSIKIMFRKKKVLTIINNVEQSGNQADRRFDVGF